MRVVENYNLKSHNSYQIESVCRRAYFPSTEEDFVQIYTTAPDHKKVLIGGGYNIIFSKPYYEDDFIIVGEAFSKRALYTDTGIVAEAGTDIRELSEYALQHELSGLEIFYDIPSTVGGAVVMNAGASGEELKDVLLKVRYLDLEDLQIKEIYKKDINFEYRNSFFQRQANKVVLKSWLTLVKGDAAKIREKMDTIKAARWAKQPKEFPNAGSVFKRPPGYFVGQIMDQLKLKGYAIGGAKISEKHGGFIINFNNASGQDILRIIQHVQHRVKDELGVDLEIEQRII